MDKTQNIQNYLDCEFSSGYTTGEDYKTFERIYINILKSMCKENDWELVKINKNHYEFSAFFKFEDKYIYMSISDVRYFKNEWFTHILYRTAKNDTDYHGGTNLYTDLPSLRFAIKNLFNKGF